MRIFIQSMSKRSKTSFFLCYNYYGDIMHCCLSEYSKALMSNPWYWVPIILCIIIIIVYYKFGSKITGWFGEHWAKQSLDYLDKDKYVVLNDIMIAVNGKTHQIDHIVLSKYGIFVIETKQYNGYITGSKYDKQWVRHFKGNELKYYTNPIRQNYGHVKVLCQLFNISEKYVFNIVCIPSKNVKLNIKHDGELTTTVDIIDKILSYKDELIDNVDELKDKIMSNNITDKAVKKRHVEKIKSVKEFYDDKTCPSCGGQLKLKTGKYGNFLGCSNYPKCKYTRKV